MFFSFVILSEKSPKTNPFYVVIGKTLGKNTGFHRFFQKNHSIISLFEKFMLYLTVTYCLYYQFFPITGRAL